MASNADGTNQPPSELTTLLDRLAAAGIDFIVVGGIAAVAQGATFPTFDLDIVHETGSENIAKLLALLNDLNARHRRPGSDILRPTEADLSSGGHCLLMTDLGPLDALCRIEKEATYADLLPDTISIEIGGNVVRVLRLERMVELKRDSPNPKDQRTVELIEATLHRRAENG